MSNATNALIDAFTALKGELSTLTVADGTTVTGVAVSVNSKGFNIKVDGKVRSIVASRIRAVTRTPVDADGYTTADVAAMVGMDPKALRVVLRALAMGVGKGSRYGLTDADVAAIKAHLANADA